MKILLTGSGGFIGGCLKRAWQARQELYCPRSFELDLCDRQAVCRYLGEHECEVIVHCGTRGGARGIADEPQTAERNLAMLNHLLSAKAPTCRLITFGSGAMYGRFRDLQRIKEEEIGRYQPEDLYGQSKVEVARLIAPRDDCVCLNIFACYGLGEKESRPPSYCINQVLSGHTIELQQNRLFDYLYADDMVRIVGHFLTSRPKFHNVLNITPDASTEIVEIARQAIRLNGGVGRITVAKEGLGFAYTGANERLHAEMPDLVFTPLEEGLGRLYTQLKTRREAEA